MNLTQIVDALGEVTQAIEADHRGPLPQYQPATPAGKRGYNHVIDAMNRLPRPVMALLTLAIFIGAGLNPQWFEARMQALAAVPEPMWWIIGAVITFFFGARESHYLRTTAANKPGKPSAKA